MQIFDYSVLLGKIKEVCGTQAEFCKRMGMSTRKFEYRLSGKTAFRNDEIYNALSVLGIPAELVSIYFFTPKVYKDK